MNALFEQGENGVVQFVEFVEFVGFVEFIRFQWRYGRDAMETIRDSRRLVEVSGDTFEIQMPACQRTCPAGRPKPK